jgi:hypothetical protein
LLGTPNFALPVVPVKRPEPCGGFGAWPLIKIQGDAKSRYRVRNRLSMRTGQLTDSFRSIPNSNSTCPQLRSGSSQKGSKTPSIKCYGWLGSSIGFGPPAYVWRSLRAYLRCGILAHGFARAGVPAEGGSWGLSHLLVPFPVPPDIRVVGFPVRSHFSRPPPTRSP